MGDVLKANFGSKPRPVDPDRSRVPGELTPEQKRLLRTDFCYFRAHRQNVYTVLNVAIAQSRALIQESFSFRSIFKRSEKVDEREGAVRTTSFEVLCSWLKGATDAEWYVKQCFYDLVLRECLIRLDYLKNLSNFMDGHSHPHYKPPE